MVMFRITTFVGFLLILGRCGWTSTALIDAGQMTVVNNSSPNTYVWSVSYGYTVSELPNVAVVIASIDIDNRNAQSFSMVVQGVATTSFELVMAYDPGTNVKALDMYYMTRNSSFSYMHMWNNIEYPPADATSVASGSGFRSSTTIYSFPSSDYTINTGNQVSVLAWIQGISIDSAGNDYNMSLYGAVDTSQSVKLTLEVSFDSTISNLTYCLLIYDDTTMLATGFRFADYGVLTATNNQWSSLTVSLVFKTANNFIAGLSGIGFAASEKFKYTFNFGGFTYTSGNPFHLMQISYWSYREAQCTTGFTADPVTAACTEICGDAILFNLGCDDGNLINGDGCSSTCTVESGWTCSGGSSTARSVCTAPSNYTATLTYSVKNSTRNSIWWTFLITPYDSNIELIDFSNSALVRCNISLQNITIVNFGQGLIQVSADYTVPIQFETLTMTFDLAKSGLAAYAGVQPISTSIVVDPNNNLQADFYSQSVYDNTTSVKGACIALLCLYLIVIGLAFYINKKYVAIETVAVGQAALLGLCLIQYLGPYFGSLSSLKYVNSINVPIHAKYPDTSMSTPQKLVGISYDAPLVYNLNLGLIVLLLPGAIALVLYLVTKCRPQQTDKLMRVARIAYYQYGFTAVVFLFTHWVLASEAMFGYITTPESEQLLSQSILVFVLFVVYTLPVLLLFQLRPSEYGEYRTAFRPTKFCQHYYWMVIACKFVLATILVAGLDWRYTGFMAMLVPITTAAILIWQKPYKEKLDNIRAITNEAFTLAILAIYAYEGGFVDWTQTASLGNDSLAYLVVALLYISLIPNAGYVCLLISQEVISKRSLESEEKTIRKYEMGLQLKAKMLTKGKSSPGAITTSMMPLREIMKGKAKWSDEPSSRQRENDTPVASSQIKDMRSRLKMHTNRTLEVKVKKQEEGSNLRGISRDRSLKPADRDGTS